MEVIFSLHSPIPEETEVFGQFKQFVENYEKFSHDEPGLKKLLLDMVTDAKAVRQRHLVNLAREDVRDLFAPGGFEVSFFSYAHDETVFEKALLGINNTLK
jgi:hypothetical protein